MLEALRIPPDASGHSRPRVTDRENAGTDFLALLTAPLQIRTRAEGALAAAGEYRHPDLLVIANSLPYFAEFGGHRRMHGVEYFGTVERDPGDVVL